MLFRSIPDEVYNVAKLELSHDSKLKLNILKEQDEMIQEENLREKDTVNHVKDNIKLDEYEETATEGMKIEQDEPGEKSSESEKTEQDKSDKHESAEPNSLEKSETKAEKNEAKASS